MGLIDFKLDVYDYLTFLILLLVVIAFFYAMITLGGLPGKLAEKRNHPHAESVKLGGWIGLFTIFPWIHALIWAYHDSLTIDVRKLPKDMRKKLEGGSAVDADEKLDAGIVSRSAPEEKPGHPEGTNGDEGAS
ncbi:DUF3302 domain-containing protein [Roseibium sp. SCP14]|uniref:DUF3302 domain-containing protein n=1 Tax=Roseibium sp. SCP14 TaxID=3141375 RepID=UPI0033387A40